MSEKEFDDAYRYLVRATALLVTIFFVLGVFIGRTL